MQNRDRLELYALHKQAVSSDAPPSTTPIKSQSPAERAKLQAWRTKRGLSQSQAMTAYILEADRQLLVYGTAPSTTPNNTPYDTNSTSNHDETSQASASVLLTPRGLAAVPLLCAAASESRQSYLSRLASTNRMQDGWWIRQEPLCGDPGTIMALPEMLVLTMAGAIERASLFVNLDPTISRFVDRVGVRAGPLQSLLWPLHNVFLVVWIMVILISTLTGSGIITIKTMLLGRKRTGVALDTIFAQEIRPCQRGALSLCEPHQATSVRLLGLLLYPMRYICDFSERAMKVVPFHDGAQMFSGALFFVATSLMLWWYWFVVLPWVAIGGLVFSLNIGWCFGLIELARIK